MTTDTRLPSWNDGPAKTALLQFLDAASGVPRAERVAVFDNDGTLWVEKPNYIQLEFMLSELARAVAERPELARRAEYRALIDHDAAAQAELGLGRIALALVELCEGIEPSAFDERVRGFFDAGRHRDRNVAYLAMRYRPMLELIDELRAIDFDVFLVSGGGTEFVRAIGDEFYGVAPERVVGTSVRYEFTRDESGRPRLLRSGDVSSADANEGAAKVANIQLQLGRRPIFAAGNSPGDGEMLEYAAAAAGPTMALLIDHDDAEREYAYTGVAATFESAEPFVETARQRGWTVVSMREDWATVFSD